MILFLLLVIVAILLFGASAVIGAAGRILGFIALLAALFVAVLIAKEVPAWFWWTCGIVVGGGILALSILYQIEQAKLRRDLADIEERGRLEIERIKEDGARRVAEIRRGTDIKFHNDGLNKKKRKALQGRKPHDR